MYDGWFKTLSWHRSTAMAGPRASSGSVRCDAVPVGRLLLLLLWKLVTVHIVLPHYQTVGTMICYPDSVTLSWHWENQSLHYPHNAERQAREWQVSNFKSNQWHWFDLTRIRKLEVWVRTRDLRIPRSPRTGGGCYYSFGHHDWLKTTGFLNHWL